MLQQLKTDLKLHRSRFFSTLLTLPAFFLPGFIMVLIIMNVDATATTWFCLGSMLAAVALVMFAVFLGIYFHQDFMLALSMGCTRKAFVGAFILRKLLWMAAGYALVLGMYLLEMTVYPLLFPGLGNEMAFDFLLDLRIVIPVMLCTVIVSLFIGAIYSRFGQKGWLTFYFVFMGVCILLPRLIAREAVLEVLILVPLAAWITLGAAAIAAMLITAILLVRKQMVR